MDKLYRIVYVEKESKKDGVDIFTAKDSWMISSNLNIEQVYEMLDEYNDKIQELGFSGRLVVDEGKPPIKLEDFLSDFNFYFLANMNEEKDNEEE